MTPKEFTDRMLEIATSTDYEGRHGDGDDLMCEVLAMLGYHEGVDVFKKMEKWYA